jgi:alpha-glucosidase
LQRYALHWTGDNSSWWEHLWMAMPQLQNLGLSGVAWTGVDVGGFFGDTNPELFTRFTEFGIFQPFAATTRATGRSSKSHGALVNRGSLISGRCFSCASGCFPTYIPCLKSVTARERPYCVLCSLTIRMIPTYAADDQFLLGEALLVAPITRPSIEYRHVYLPRGTWFHLWSGKQFKGPTHILQRAPWGNRPSLCAQTPPSRWRLS